MAIVQSAGEFYRQRGFELHPGQIDQSFSFERQVTIDGETRMESHRDQRRVVVSETSAQVSQHRSSEVKIEGDNFTYSLSLRETYLVRLEKTEDGILFTVVRTREVIERLYLPAPDIFVTRNNTQTSDSNNLASKNTQTSFLENSCEKCCSAKENFVLQTEGLRKVRNKGMQIIRGHLFPLFSRIGNEIFAFILFLNAVIMFGLSLRTFILICVPNGTNCTLFDPTQQMNYTDSIIKMSENPIEYVRFAISTVSVILALLNTIVSMRHCYVFKCLCCCSCNCCKHKKSHKNKSCCSKLKNFLIKYVNDLFRLLIIEALLYPTLICSILENAGSRTYEGTPSEVFTFARFIFSCASTVWNVYIIRLIVLCSTIYNLEKLRKGNGPVEYDNEYNPQDWKMDTIENIKDNKFRARKGLALEIFFSLHVFGQMLTQAFMIAAIWSKVQCENPLKIDGSDIYISPFTWVMIVLGFVVPIIGTLTFFIPTYYWGQEYPVDFMVNFLSGLKKPKLAEIKAKARENCYNIVELVGKIRNELLRRSFFSKLLYPFFDPVLVSICMFYDTLLLPFAVFYFIGLQETQPANTSGFINRVKLCALEFNTTYVKGRSTPVFVPSGWFLLGVIGFCIGNIANIVVIFIGLLWGIIIPAIILSVLASIPCLLVFYPCFPLFCCLFCLSTKQKLYDRPQYYYTYV